MNPGTTARGSDEWIERVRAASDIVEVISETVALKRVGRNWVGLCPFHGEKTPSFSVHPERQFYHCFSCKVGGDVFKFVQETERLGFVEAAELLSRRAGIPVPERRAAERGVRTPLLEALEAAAAAYEQWLGDPGAGAECRAYLERRGIGYEIQREFRLGLAPAGWDHLALRLKGRHAEETLVAAGLASRRDGGRGVYDRFRNRLMVPLIAPGGAAVGFGARALAADDQPKYLNSPETAVYHKGAFLYALEQSRRHLEPDGEVVVVEGYFDAIALHQAGLRNVVATSGTALTPEQAKLLRRSSARVALTYDGDEAGQEAMLRSLGTLLATGLDVVVVDLPPGTDPDELVRRGGHEAWREARSRAADPVEFVQRHGLRRATRPGAPVSDPRERALQAVVRLAAGIDDPIRMRLLLERASQVFGLTEAVLARAVELRRSGETSPQPIRAAVREQTRVLSHLERELLQALLLAPERLEGTRAELSPEDFVDPACAALAGSLWSGDEDLAEILASNPLARELTVSAAGDRDWTRVVADDVRGLVTRRLERERREAQRRTLELQRRGTTMDDPELRELLRRNQELADRIREMNR